MIATLARYALDRSRVVTWVGIGVVALYFAFLTHAVRSWSYDEWMVVALVPILFAIGLAIITATTRSDVDPLTTLIGVALAVKLGASFVRYYVAFSLYGSGDSQRYDEVGREIANSFHRGELAIVDLVSLRQGSEFVDDLTGLVYAITGPSRLGGFVIFSWLGFWGLFLFHRAARIGLPEGDQQRYALLVFFLPSLVFWPSSIGKEALMIFSLGVCAYGAARVLERRSMGWFVLLAGLGLGYMVRPHVSVVVLGGLAVAIAFRPRRNKRAMFSVGGRVLTVAVLVGALAFLLGRAADQLLPSNESSGITAVGDLLDRAETGTNSGGSEIDRPTPNSPLEYPQAVFSVLFRPTIFEANSAGNLVAAAETTFVLVLGVLSWRRLRNAGTMAFRRPYVLFCFVYTAIFTFAWSSFSNLGALARQRVQVWPFVLIVLALPLALPKERKSAVRRSLVEQPQSVPAAR